MRINLYGGPGSTKSSTAAYLYSQLKKENRNLELILEHVKTWVAMKREILPFGQLTLLGKQIEKEEIWLAQGTDIISDSPVLLAAIYYYFYENNQDVYKGMLDIVRAYDTRYPSVNIVLDRGDLPFNCSARLQDAMQSKQLDMIIENEVEKIFPNNYKVFYYKDQDKMLDYVKSKLNYFDPLKHEQSK